MKTVTTDPEELIDSTSQTTNESELTELNVNQNNTVSEQDQSDYLCCDLGIDAPDRYQWLTFEDCRSLGGRAADNSMCGH
jgi:hypothetical protein